MSASTSNPKSPSTSPPMSASPTTPVFHPPDHGAEPCPLPDVHQETPHSVSASAPGVVPVAAIPVREPDPFRFLDLPPELRDMVYESVDFTNHRYVLPQHDPEGRPRWEAANDVDKTITMVRKSLSFEFLATCKQIHVEAHEIFEKKLRDLELQPVQFCLGYGAASIITPQPGSESTDSPLIHCFNVRKARSHKPADSEEIIAFVARSSSFIKHCQSATGKGRVEFIVDTLDLTSGVHSTVQVWYAIEGARSISVGWDLPWDVALDVTFTLHKQVPDCRTTDEDSVELYPGKRLLKTLLGEHQNQGCANFRLKNVKKAKTWAKILKGKE